MSGPKVDEAALARQKQLELEEEARRQAQMLSDAIGELMDAQDGVRQMQRDMQAQYRQLAADAADEPALAGELEKLRAVMDRCLARADQCLYTSVPGERMGVEALASDTRSAARDIEADYRSAAGPHIEAIRTHLQDVAKARDFALRQGRAVAAREQFIRVQDVDFASLIAQVERQPDLEEQARQSAVDVFRRIEAVVNSGCITARREGQLNQLAEGLYKAVHIGSDSVRAAVVQCQAVLGQAEVDARAFDELYQEYCRQYILHFSRQQETRDFVVPKERHRFRSLEELQEECEQLAETAAAARERDYIRRQLDEVMRLFGYSTTAELVLHEEQTGAHYLSQKDGGSAAIHMYLSDANDSIMMETVSVAAAGMGEQDHIVDAGQLDEDEKERLVEQQTQFCRMHPQIIAELEKRGVVLSEMSRQPVGEQFCRRIVASSVREQTVQARDAGLYYQFRQTPAARLRQGQTMAMPLD